VGVLLGHEVDRAVVVAILRVLAVEQNRAAPLARLLVAVEQLQQRALAAPCPFGCAKNKSLGNHHFLSFPSPDFWPA
jgi:hypothetical protein